MDEKTEINERAKLGMWLFILTEIILFGGMFLLYAAFHSWRAPEFHAASSMLNIYLGTANTVILLTSSLTVALSIASLKREERKLCMLLLAATIVLASIFLVDKYFEWSAEIHHGIFPDSPELLDLGPGKTIFFGLYFIMTGLHALHVIIGMGILSVMFYLVRWGHVAPSDMVKLENSGLYWHLVDVIWIFLFPLFYLVP